MKISLDSKGLRTEKRIVEDTTGLPSAAILHGKIA